VAITYENSFPENVRKEAFQRYQNLIDEQVGVFDQLY
jgi:hypothetical protein